MWNWLSCYLSGRHAYGMWCEPGTIFLRCIHCGRRSCGWIVDPRGANTSARPNPRLLSHPAATHSLCPPPVQPFNRAAAS